MLSSPVSVPCCPKCRSDKRQAKAGKNGTGNPRFHCHACDKDYVLHPKPRGYPAQVRHEAVRLSVEGLSLRRIARILSVNHQSVANWIFAYQQTLQAAEPATLPDGAIAACEIVELDELYTFIGSKRGEKNTGSTLGLPCDGG